MSINSSEQTTRQRRDNASISIADLQRIGSIRSALFKTVPNLTDSYLKMKESNIGLDNVADDPSSRPSPEFKPLAPFSTRFHDKVTTILKAEIRRSIMLPRKTSTETLALVPMNNIRNVLLMACIMMFSVAPLMYMPLGIIQAAYNNKCFLHTRINISLARDGPSNETFGGTYTLMFEAVGTEWGEQFYCDFTTFVPVSIAILAVIIGWSTFTIWPAMISLGKGGVLMLLNIFISLVSLVVSTISALTLRDGYAETCRQFALDAFDDGINITCKDLSHVTFPELVEAQTNLADDVNAAMELAQIGAWSLVTLTGFKVLISSYTFVLIWIYAHYFLFPLSYKDSMCSDPSASE